MDPNLQWQPSALPPSPPARPAAARGWLPAAIIGGAIVLAAGLIGGAMILKRGDSAQAGPTTCGAWSETRLTLRSIPGLPNGWTWQTPNISTDIKKQNAPVARALDLFESKIAPEPVDVAEAARDYVSARRSQMQALSDRTYTAQTGEKVDAALAHLNELCGIPLDGPRI